MSKQFDIEDIMMALEHVQNQRSGPPVAPAQPPSVSAAATPSTMLEKIMGNAPAWIGLVLMVVTSYVILNTRLTTVEYQNTVSITDRVALHLEIKEATKDMTDVKSNIASMKTDLTDIKEAVHDLANKRH